MHHFFCEFFLYWNFCFFVLLIQSSGAEKKYPFKETDVFKRASGLKINCNIRNETVGLNPSYCWAFAKYGNEHFYPNPSKHDCCHLSELNSTIPGQLQNIVEIKEDGIHIHYQKYLAAHIKNREGLLIPLASTWKNRIEFTIRPFDQKPGVCDLLGDRYVDDDYRFLKNHMRFSYGNDGSQHKDRTPGDLEEYADHRWRKMRYGEGCSAICEELLYLPHKTAGNPNHEHNGYPFRIMLNEASKKFEWDFVQSDSTEYFLIEQKWREKEHRGPWYKPWNYWVANLYHSIQPRWDLCNVELQKWPTKKGEEQRYYLPFRFLWPYVYGTEGDFEIMLNK